MSKNLASPLRFLFVLLGVVAVIASGGGSSSSTPPPVVSPTPNANFVVFLADGSFPSTAELYKYSLALGTTKKVNLDLNSGGQVSSFAISPDRKWIAYIATAVSGTYHLYVRDATLASAPVQLSTLEAGGGHGASNLAGLVSDEPVWAPNSSRIAYRNDARLAGTFELSTVVPTSGTPVDPVVVSNIPDGRAVSAGSYTWSPDSSQVAYRANQNSPGNVDLYTNPGDETGSLANNNLINDMMAGGDNVTDYVWAPDNSRLAYYVLNQLELYTGIRDGSGRNPVGVIGSSNGSAGVPLLHYAWAPNSLLIAFVADRNIAGAFELYVVEPDGMSVPKRVSRIATASKEVKGPPSWAPNGSHIAYLGDLEMDNTDELYTSSPTVADDSVRVNSTLKGGQVETGPFSIKVDPPAWAPDSSRIAYVAQQDVVDVKEVYAGLPDGSSNSKLSGSMALNGDAQLGVDGEVWSPGTATLTLSYKADQDSSGTEELWATTGTTNPKLTNTPVITTGLQSFALWAPDGSQVIYVSEQDTAGIAELYMSSADGSSKQKISIPLVAGRNVDKDSIAWAP